MLKHAFNFIAKKLGVFLLAERTQNKHYYASSPKNKNLIRKSTKISGGRTYEQLCATLNPNVLYVEILLPGNTDYIDDLSNKNKESLLDQKVVPLHQSQVKELIPANDDVAESTKKLLKRQKKNKADKLHFTHARPVMIRFSRNDTLLVEDDEGSKEFSMGPGSGRPLEIIPEDHIDLHIDKETYGYIRIGEGAF